MKAEVRLSQLWWNPSLLDFFFTTQGQEQFQSFFGTFDNIETAISIVDAYCIDNDMDLDEVANLFHECTNEELLKELGFESLDDEED